MLLSQGGTALLAFILAALIGRGWGEVGLGQYATVMAWIMPLTLLADSGINTLMTRDLADTPQLASAYIARILRLRLWIGGGLVAGLWVVAPYLSSDEQVVWGLRLAAPMLLIDTCFGLYTAVWRAWEITWPILLFNLLLLMLQIAGVLLVLWGGGGITQVIAAVMLADGLQWLATWLLWRARYFQPPDSTLSIQGNLLRRAFPFAIGGILGALHLRLPVLLLEYAYPGEAVGWLAAVNRFMEAARMPAFAVFGAAFPVLARIDQPHRLTYRIAAGLGLYGLVILMMFTLIGGDVLTVVFGAPFQAAGNFLPVYSLILVVALPRAALTLLLYARQRAQFANACLLGGLIVQAGVGWLLIPLTGLGGVWLAVLLSECLMLPPLIWGSRRVSPV